MPVIIRSIADQPRRRPNPTTVVLATIACVGAVGMLGVAFTWAGIVRRSAAAQDSATCRSNLKMLALATLLYAQDWNERLPPADRARQAIAPYRKTATWTCPTGTPYKFNQRLSYASLFDVPSATTPLWQETTTKDPGTYPHGRYANVAYVDGHVSYWPQSRLTVASDPYIEAQIIDLLSSHPAGLPVATIAGHTRRLTVDVEAALRALTENGTIIARDGAYRLP